LLAIATSRVAVLAGGNDLGIAPGEAKQALVDEIIVDDYVGLGDAFAAA